MDRWSSPTLNLAACAALWCASGAVTAQETIRSPLFTSTCTVGLPAIEPTASPSFGTLVEAGAVTSREIASASYRTLLDVLCAPDDGCLATLCGDCNGDGLVSILDALAASRHAVLLITITGPEFDSCDVDSDTDVDVLDALRIAQIAAGLTIVLTCCQ